jgi:hypothetical protein
MTYQRPGVPLDEADMVMLLWHYVASGPGLAPPQIKTRCGCRAHFDDQAFANSMSVIGSSKYNQYCAKLMERLEELERTNRLTRDTRYVFRFDEKRVCRLEDWGNPNEPALVPGPEVGGDDLLKDYALMMKLPNICHPGSDGVNRGQTLFLFAGCKTGGQVALTQWFSDPQNLVYLTEKYGSECFYVVLEVTYKYNQGGPPKVMSKQKYKEGKITLRS